MKRILIVGGSSGIGKALLQEKLKNSIVYNISRNPPDISHSNLNHYSVDILKDALPEIENIDALIYCPGSINLKPIQSLHIDDFRNDFEINVIGAVKVIQKYLPILKKGKNPSIVLFSTVAAKLGMPFHASIAASKSAVEGIVKSLGAELAGQVRINAVAPTIIETPLSASILRNDKMRETIKERHPMKNYLQSQEVAQMADYLISDSASSISGQVFVMDYGLVSFKI
ncbi:oxidoreductase [Flavobacterium sp. Root901]|uniref:SDR family NAD(P)-dependent oxidoreductase n=1 Tax=Flavobacterium sp. Root901 TaxID=1736605 RepID=UPI00070A546B|nr:SDR family oxidoreductase [Flavobacterium sp. Root901]KRD05091.1 oxidoreductase [Flavobacterium sp. Root901]